MLKYIDTSVVEIFEKGFEKADVRLFIKREDQNHSFVSGNKWWKLKYNLEEAAAKGYKTLLTFGGAFSNHIYATAAAAKELGFKSIGIIRGEEALPLNETLSFARSSGMQLHFISRERYRHKTDQDFIDDLRSEFGNFYLITEGGTNVLAVKGCAEFAKEKLSDIDFNYLCLPVGTGGTLAGIVSGLSGAQKVIGFSVLKHGEFLIDEVKQLISNFSDKQRNNWRIEINYHFGGYAKKTQELDEFIDRVKNEHNIPLDFIYTGKMMAGIFDLISKNYFQKGSKILALHTGGLRY